ncbi:peptide/nickel transport system ATP-binding protein [Parafrankia irregularis]|uniref:Peptide/nickel transport system ATP-binding protein n=1 Tax=Parafrankia irregularis TaxID=795642 RepID=A0A0S4QNY0_9ACTN|nr:MULTISPECIES: dipeptide/oligopeptide/nickel ABC transporter ATP-binding protein [Parafrankia]MBE3200589.1 ABC transporter ATP-binding protein [Parafrankia sp. CH37]CUU56921.1 peptide/nickel transport system ATP-binding protein [Parafrankia irregularis]
MSALLDIEDLVVEYPAEDHRGGPAAVLRGVSIAVQPGECLGIVGSHGAGKTTLGRAVLGQAPVASGSIRFKGRDIVALSHPQRRRLDEKIQAVFRDAHGSLDPAATVEAALTEPLRAEHVPAGAAARRVRELLNQVGVPAGAGQRLPGELSGDQRQRIAIARALTLSPELIICDDPLSALDPRAGHALLELLMEVQESTGTAYVFFSPDLAAVRRISHHIAFLEQGRITERGEGGRDIPVPRFGCEWRWPGPDPIPIAPATHQAARWQRFQQTTGRPRRHADGGGRRASGGGGGAVGSRPGARRTRPPQSRRPDGRSRRRRP